MTNLTQISTVAQGVISLIEVGKEIYEATVNAMDSVERQGVIKGCDKKEWVLCFIKNFVIEIGKNWEDWFELISNFIDNIKSVYNTIKHLIK